MRICNPPELFNFLSPLVIYIYSTVELETQYYREEMQLAARLPHFQVNFLIFSNSTFRQRENERMKVVARKHAYVGQVVVVVLGLWLLVMPLLPLRLVTGDIAISVSLMTKMCRAVRQIKGKDEL